MDLCGYVPDRCRMVSITNTLVYTQVTFYKEIVSSRLGTSDFTVKCDLGVLCAHLSL